jgi:hypothetical protein
MMTSSLENPLFTRRNNDPARAREATPSSNVRVILLCFYTGGVSRNAKT